VKLLALESATDACSVALTINGETKTDHRIAPQKHAQLLLPMIDTILVDAGITARDLDGIAFGCGPGSFTGIRIAAAATQGIAFGADIGVIPVSSLQALAQGAYRTQACEHVFASFDARMGEGYWGVYAMGSGDVDNTDNILQPLQQDCVCAPQAVVIPVGANADEWALVGSGADQYKDELRHAIDPNVLITFISDGSPSAQDILSVALPVANAGGFVPAEDALPVYLRNRVALTEAQRAAGEQLSRQIVMFYASCSGMGAHCNEIRKNQTQL